VNFHILVRLLKGGLSGLHTKRVRLGGLRTLILESGTQITCCMAIGDHRWHISIQVGRIARVKNATNAEL